MSKFQVSLVFRFAVGSNTYTYQIKDISRVRNVIDLKLLTLNLYYNSDALVFINKILMRQITYLHLVISALPSHSFLLRLSTSFWTIREVIWSNCDLISIVSACAFFYFVLSHFRYLFDLLLHITIFVTSKFENI